MCKRKPLKQTKYNLQTEKIFPAEHYHFLRRNDLPNDIHGSKIENTFLNVNNLRRKFC